LGMTEDEAFQCEKSTILEFKTNIHREYEPGQFGVGYNQTDGGDGPSGHVHTPETRKLMSTLKKGKPSKLKGRRGFIKSLESKQKQSRTRKARCIKPSNETREKMRAAHLGSTHTTQTRNKLSIMKKGKCLKPETQFVTKNVMTIRFLIALGCRRSELADLFQVSLTAFNRILRKTTVQVF